MTDPLLDQSAAARLKSAAYDFVVDGDRRQLLQPTEAHSHHLTDPTPGGEHQAADDNTPAGGPMHLAEPRSLAAGERQSPMSQIDFTTSYRLTGPRRPPGGKAGSVVADEPPSSCANLTSVILQTGSCTCSPAS